MYSIYIKSKDIDKIKLCDKEAFSLIKVNDSLNVRFQDLDQFESCRKKIYSSIKDPSNLINRANDPLLTSLE